MMFLRRSLIVVALICAAIAGYGASALLAAWQVREAMRNGDIVTLQERVDWASVRRSLKSSIGETREVLAEITEAAGAPKPSLWTRFKSAALPFVSDPLIDRYVTAEAAPKLYSWRQSWRNRVGTSVPETAGDGTGLLAGTGLGRALGVARKVQRLALVSPGRIEIVIGDTFPKRRQWFIAMELRATRWTVTEIRALPAPAARQPSAVRPALAKALRTASGHPGFA